MERKVKFTQNEYYHVFTRGVEKRKIFMNNRDYDRFMALLYVMNQPGSFRFDNFLKDKKKRLHDVFDLERQKTLVSIFAYAIMPNHLHLFLHEKEEGGITKFLSKLLTAYSMYFNTKYERSGPLFVHPFRSVHIENESQFINISQYIHLNPLDIREPDWKEIGIKNKKGAKEFLKEYTYSSYRDFLGEKRSESKILETKNVPETIARATLAIEKVIDWS